MSRKERRFQGITREIRNLSENNYLIIIFVSNNFVSEGMSNPRPPNQTNLLHFLTVFHADFGKKFLPEFSGEVHPETAPLQALCAVKGRKGAKNRVGRGVASKGGRKEKTDA